MEDLALQKANEESEQLGEGKIMMNDKRDPWISDKVNEAVEETGGDNMYEINGDDNYYIEGQNELIALSDQINLFTTEMPLAPLSAKAGSTFGLS